MSKLYHFDGMLNDIVNILSNWGGEDATAALNRASEASRTKV